MGGWAKCACTARSGCVGVHGEPGVVAHDARGLPPQGRHGDAAAVRGGIFYTDHRGEYFILKSFFCTPMILNLMWFIAKLRAEWKK